jgi:hypothetical protein
MKIRLFLLVAAAIASTGVAAQARYDVLRPQVQLWSGPNDDMRPQIVGDVVRVDPQGVALYGGAYIPVMAAAVHTGQHVTFTCTHIDTGDNPRMNGCELSHVDPPPAPHKDGKVHLW